MGSGSMSSGRYASGNSGMSGINQHSNQMLGSTSSGGYSSGNAQRNMHSSTGSGNQRNINLRSSSLSSGSQSVPEIEYNDILETLEEFSQADQGNTVFIQNHGSAGNNGIQNYGSSGSYGMQNQGSSGNFGMQNGNSAGSFGMQNRGSSGMQNIGSSASYETQNHGSSGSVGVHNQGSSSNGISDMNYQSVGYY